MDKQFLSIDAMKEKISMFGGWKIWYLIEQMSNVYERVAYRKLFFLAGGSLEPENLEA